MIILQKKYQYLLIAIAATIPVLCLFLVLNQKNTTYNKNTTHNNQAYNIKKLISQNKLKLLKVNVIPKKHNKTTTIEPIQFLITGDLTSLSNLIINILNQEQNITPSGFTINKINNKLFLQLNLLLINNQKQPGQLHD